MFKLILRTLESDMTLRLPIITCLAGGYEKKYNFDDLRSRGLLESILTSVTTLLKVYIVDLLGLLTLS